MCCLCGRERTLFLLLVSQQCNPNPAITCVCLHMQAGGAHSPRGEKPAVQPRDAGACAQGGAAGQTITCTWHVQHRATHPNRGLCRATTVAVIMYAWLGLSRSR